ncbi:MAG: alpha-galactosidase [Proteobacteria bacterium]|nr:alpha-galactosidase [Pseudomonadota bacterium]
MRLISAFALPAVALAQRPAAPAAEPPDRPATIERTDSTIAIRYAGRLLFAAKLAVTGTAPDVRVSVDSGGGVVTQVIKWTARGAGGHVRLSGTVHTSVQGFAAEPEPAQDARPIVRHAVGAAHNLLNRGVYDRRGDWLLSVDHPAHIDIVAGGTGDSVTTFRLAAEGGEVALRFRPRYYQKHRGLAEYRPWTYEPWRGSVTGWSSWYAFFDKVTEADVRRTADVLGEVLRPFGVRYLQIDDGYQQTPIGTPDHWLNANAKFPSGLAALRRYISDHGLEPGIWTNVSFAQRDSAMAHPEWFVRDRDGRPAYGNWVGYVMDGSDPATIAALVRPVYDSLAHMGWSYFKLDALRHLRYEGYNSFADYFAAKGRDREAVYRGFVEQVRGMVGRDHYLLACWGVRPELIGLVDGVRLGDDGFGYGSFAQYNSFNNVVWRNDPDHIELRQPDRYRATTITSLTGSALMITDPPEVYRTDKVDAAKRAAPVLFTRPGQLYDVDPSRSSLLYEAGRQVSGAGPRPFDADQRLVVPLYQLDVARPFEQWTVLARTGGDDPAIPFSDLGLPAATDFVAFEFWTKRSLGVVRDTLRAPPVDPAYQVQAICLRRRADHPQLLSTNRHVTCGGFDLANVSWFGRSAPGAAGGGERALRGTSDVVAGDPYVLYVTEPDGYRLSSVSADGAEVLGNALVDGVRVVRLLSRTSRRIEWTVRYE